MKNSSITREQYLLAAVDLLRPLFKHHGSTIPPVKVSVGWPSTRGTSAKRRVIGQCWDKSAASDKVAQIFISPFLGEAFPAVDTLTHELVHAVLGSEAGHGPKFRKLALSVGLVGKMTSCGAGPELKSTLEGFIKTLGKYPHAKLDARKSGIKKQGTRMIKCECGKCGYVVRTSQKWLDVATPLCPVHPREDMNIG